MKPILAISALAAMALWAPIPTRAQSAPTLPNFTHVYIIVMENHEFSDIIGNSSAPYINSLAGQYALGTAYTAITHPSLPNYMALTGGDTFFADDCIGCVVIAPNIADQIEASGRHWKAYMEDMAAPCTTDDNGPGSYTVHHNPFVHYDDIVNNASRCQASVVPLSTLGTDLIAGTVPDYVWITPNLCSDMHDCSVATGDAWLQAVIPAIINTPDFSTSALFLVWDEGTSSVGGGGTVPMLIVSPLVKPGFQSTVAENHFSLLRTIQDAWGLAPLAQSTAATAMTEYFNVALKPPAVVTGAAGGVTSTTAMLNGTANPNGVATNAHFEYGLTTGYGTTTPVQAMGSGTSALAIGGGGLTGLACGTLYHFRATATNASGTTPGSDATFMTTACGAPTVTTGAASAITPTSAMLNGIANPNGSATTADFQYGVTTGYGGTTAGQAIGSGTGAVAIGGGALTGLACNTQYHFRAMATNAAGTTYGADATFMTARCSTPGTPDDFNGDGTSDLLWRDTATGQNVIWLMHGGTESSSILLPTVGDLTWNIKGVGDFTGSGTSDLLWRNTVTGQNVVWLMNGGALSSTTVLPTVALTWDIKGVGDVNGDGRADVIWRNNVTGQNVVWLMNGGALSSTAVLPTVALTWDIKGLGDFNGDGQADLLWRNTATGQNVVWLMNGGALSSTTVLPTVDMTWVIKGLGDFNGDGQADVLWRNSGTGQNVVWLMNAGALSSTTVLPTVAPTWDIKEIGDVNGDGRADVIWRSTVTGQNVVWLMNAGSLSSAALLPAVADLNWDLVGPAQ